MQQQKAQSEEQVRVRDQDLSGLRARLAASSPSEVERECAVYYIRRECVLCTILGESVLCAILGERVCVVYYIRRESVLCVGTPSVTTIECVLLL